MSTGNTMNQTEFDAIQVTFPWTERTVSIGGVGGFVQVLDRHGNEVSIFTMTKFLEMITRKLMPKAAEPAQAPSAEAEKA